MASEFITHISIDIKRYQSISSLAKFGTWYLIWHTPELKALLVYRLGRWLLGILKQPLWWITLLFVGPLYIILSAYYRCAYDIHLDQSADIGPGLFIAHFGGVRVRHCTIGECCAIHQEVRLEPSRESAKGPTIGNRVWIGAHTTIQGPLIVGDRSTVGAGSVVQQDVPPGCLFLGNPARMVLKEYNNAAFL